MTHAFAAYGGTGGFDAAFFPDDTAITHVFIFTAVTLPIFRRPENRFTKQAIFFRAQTAIVDGFWFGDFTIRPGTNMFWRRQTDAQRAKILCFQGRTSPLR